MLTRRNKYATIENTTNKKSNKTSNIAPQSDKITRVLACSQKTARGYSV